MNKQIDSAIARSISHQEIVHVTCSRDELAYLRSQSEDSVATGDIVEAWGTTADGDEWRVHARVEVSQ
jgi:hypothetical protein